MTAPQPCRDLSSIANLPHGRDASGLLDGLLASGSDPNAAPAGENDLSGITQDWTSRDPLPQWDVTEIQWFPPLYRAVSPQNEARSERRNMISSVLRARADPYLPFRQQLVRPGKHTRSVHPGEDPPRKPEPDYLDDFDFSTSVLPDDPESPSSSSSSSGNKDKPPEHGLRHVLHAILEDGLSASPLLSSPASLATLGPNHRDPQGRTLLHSACRSSLGADAGTDAWLCDIQLDTHTHTGKLLRDPFTP
ncbi:hypothetical protein CONLIGDRAFT_706710 [Coniochaeta ligniaria NRRL 30616]|uniref:Uncharacterized protein n=1 Tax=Coniochaeta ligniaria NRRL 30616 TaxID=1408157 RepID=A0A1J7IGL5_9PEZI|nr:hypothetical protein CONLIGDRAFT_706710 [Coniochaeta ligniaria NRRL 30616]